jgi:hypothetical protein
VVRIVFDHPSALSKVASRHFLDAQPPLLWRRGLAAVFAISSLVFRNSYRDGPFVRLPMRDLNHRTLLIKVLHFRSNLHKIGWS